MDYCEELKGGEKVRVLRGKYRGQVFTVHQSANDWAMLDVIGIQSKRNIERIRPKEKNKKTLAKNDKKL